MNMAWKISKSALKLAWVLFKIVLVVAYVAIEATEKKRRREPSHHSPIMAHELLEKDVISLEEYNRAMES